MKILLLGDISLNGILSNQNKEIFNDAIKDYFFGHDYVFCNLECTVKSDGENHLKIPRIYTSKEAIKSLKKYNINYCNLNNNHIFDNLLDGINNTIEALDENNIFHFGVLDNKVFNIKNENENVSISILSYIDKLTHPCIPKESTLDLSFLNINSVVNDIKQEKDTNIVLFLHKIFKTTITNALDDKIGIR